MEEYEPETEVEENMQQSYNISLLDEDYELSMSIYQSFLEFKLQQNNIIVDYYYKSKYDLQTINNLLHTSFKGTKEVFNFFDKLLNDKKVKLIKLKDKNIININFKNVSSNKEIEINLELKQIKLNKDEMNILFLKEINSLKQKLNTKNEKSIEELIKDNNKELKEYINNKIEENKKIYEEKIKEKDNEIKELKEIINQLKKEQEQKLNELNNKYLEYEKVLKPLLKEYSLKEFNEYNDNVNLINNFNLIDVNKMKEIKILENNLNITYVKSVAVYKIKRNDEILYEIAYPDNNNGYNIIIYNLLNNNKNIINKAHLDNIHRIKHYYDSLTKNHILLTSSADKSIKLWNISSYPISNILHINNCFDGDPRSPFCLMFNKEDYYILGGSWNKKKNIWNKNGNLIGPIEKSQLNIGEFIESTYIDNKPYILLSGEYHSECYDYNNNTIKIYKSNNKNNIHYIVNLFKNNNKIYLISGDHVGNVIIFDFISTNEINSISVGGIILSLCSINEKYILVGNNKGELKVIDFDNKSIIKNYNAHNQVVGIEKVKINEKEEYIITYNANEIKLWK